MDESIIILTDEKGRTLHCQLEDTIEVNEIDYLLLQPVDHSVQIFAWEESEDDEEEGLLSDIEDEEVDLVFSVAQAVLAEQNLTLKRSGYTLTVSGELPEFNEDAIVTIDTDDEDISEEFQELAKFFHEEQEYSVFTALDPLMFFAKRVSADKIELLTPEELEKIRPYIEEKFIDPDADPDEES